MIVLAGKRHICKILMMVSKKAEQALQRKVLSKLFRKYFRSD